MYLGKAGYYFEASESDRIDESSSAEVPGQTSVAFYTTDSEGWLTYYNEAAAILWGRRPVIGQERWCGSWRLYEPDGTPMPHDRCPMAVALRDGRAVPDDPLIVERPDGTRVTVTPCPTALRNDLGALVAGSNVLLEIRRPGLREALDAMEHSPTSP